MTDQRKKALREFKRMVTWIVAIGVLMAVGAIVYLALSGDFYLHMVIATLGGVFFLSSSAVASWLPGFSATRAGTTGA